MKCDINFIGTIESFNGFLTKNLKVTETISFWFNLTNVSWKSAMKGSKTWLEAKYF